MARQRYIQDKKTLELIPIEEYQRTGPSGPMVIGDIQPYRSMITGEMIHGRRQHREHLRQHGCIEVGNEKLSPRKEAPLDRNAIRKAAYDALQRHGY